MDRVTITNSMLGLCAMQVCAVKDATDEEILEVCNRENRAGTTNGWCSVVRYEREGREHILPVKCAENPNRTHFIVLC